MIRFEDVAVVYGDHRAVDGIDLEIADGEFFTLLGPSGCGKTTALRALAGFVTPTSGRILFDGTDVTHLPSERRGVGMVFQNYALFPTMNVRENIEFGLRVQRRPSDERRRRVDEAADRTGLTAGQLDRNVSELSGGQQQRVAIARALVMEPRILLLDEPLSNLDAKLRVQLREQLKQLQSELGVTTVYVTHDQEEALTLSDRVAVLDAGRIEQVGTPEQIYDRSSTRFVCRFIGASNELGPGLRELLGVADARTDAYLRPERIRMTSTSDGVPGTVLKRTYHGSYVRYTVRAADTELAVDVPGSTDEHWTPDAAVSLAIDPRWVLSYRAIRP